jgi:hypothetical protein
MKVLHALQESRVDTKGPGWGIASAGEVDAVPGTNNLPRATGGEAGPGDQVGGGGEPGHVQPVSAMIAMARPGLTPGISASRCTAVGAAAPGPGSGDGTPSALMPQAAGMASVLVVAAADPEAVEAHLRPQLGQLLCVVPSKWTRAELEAVRAHLHAHCEDWNLYAWGGYTSTEDGQAKITASLTRMLPEAAAWADSLPAGILDLEPWPTRTQP